MRSVTKATIVTVLVVVVGLVLAVKQSQKAGKEPAETIAAVPKQPQVVADAPTAQTQPAGKKLPKLVDLGADKCIPCKAMKPILEDLRTNYTDNFQVVFIDVWEDSARGREYGISIIPTQIFYDADGKELFRHEGFYGKEEILAKWKEFGIDAGTGAR